MSQDRLQKIISASGVLSRRKAEEAITEGRVAVNGTIVRELGTKADPALDQITLDGKPIVAPEETILLLFHKPRRVMVTRSDPEGRPTYVDLLPPEYKNLRAIGRLDFESEGLLLLTNDGELAHQIIHPSYGIEKVYRAWVEGSPSEKALQQLVQGIELEDGPGKFVSVKKIDAKILEITVQEGRNRFVRRMCAAIGHPVHRLVRQSIGPYQLGDLPVGALAPAASRVRPLK